MEGADRVQDRLDAAAELTVVPVVKALEIDLVEIDPRSDVIQHARRAVAVRHVRGEEARGARLPKDRHGPLAGNQWFVVGRHHDTRPQARCVRDERVGRRVERRRHRGWIAQRL